MEQKFLCIGPTSHQSAFYHPESTPKRHHFRAYGSRDFSVDFRQGWRYFLQLVRIRINCFRYTMKTGHYIAMALRAAYLSMHRQTNSHLAPFRMTADQFVILALLTEQDGTTQQELAQRASSDPNTIRAMLVLLENRGLVARRRHPTDGRALRVTITRKGRQVYAKLSAAIRPLQDRLSSLFQVKETRAMILFLDRISGAMAQQEHRDNQRQLRKHNYRKGEKP